MKSFYICHYVFLKLILKLRRKHCLLSGNVEHKIVYENRYRLINLFITEMVRDVWPPLWLYLKILNTSNGNRRCSDKVFFQWSSALHSFFFIWNISVCIKRVPSDWLKHFRTSLFCIRQMRIFYLYLSLLFYAYLRDVGGHAAMGLLIPVSHFLNILKTFTR